MSLLFPPKAERITEDSLSIPLLDADDTEFRRLGAAPRDLFGVTLQKAQDLCVTLYRGNPIANRLIRIYTSFMAGTGFTVGAANPEVDGVVDEFWMSPRSKMNRHHRGFARDWLLFGEGIHPVSVDEAGNSTVGFIDPTTVEAIKRSTVNNMILTDVEVRLGQTAETKTLTIVAPNLDPFSESAGLLDGDAFVWLFDRIGAATRGTPFLLPTLDWLDAYDQVLWEMLERQKAIRAFFWDVEVDGGLTEVEKAKAAWGLTPPKSGTVRFRTAAMRVKAESPELGAAEDVEAARYHLRHIATGGGVAPHWLSEPEDANRSTAEAMDRPVLRNLIDVQAEWLANITELVQYAVDRKVAAGFLDRVVDEHDEHGQPTGERTPARDLVQVTAPEIDDKSIQNAAASIASVAQAFVQFDMLNVVSSDVMRKVVRTLLPMLGVPADELPPEDADDETIASALESFRARV